MHRALGVALLAVGGVVAVLGAGIMLVFGPDGRLTTGPHHLDTDGIAVVTAPKLISWENLQVEILAEVPVNKPVFVGIGNSVDVQSYLHRVRRLEVTEFATPWTLRTRQLTGVQQLPGAPTAVDWWIAQSAGLGGASINTTLPDETVSAAVLSVGASNLRGLTVTVAYGLKGAFVQGLGLLTAGVGLIWGGLLVRRGVSLFKDDEPDGELNDADDLVDEHVVYVWVDDDGIEHEISAEEAALHDIVDEDEGEDEGKEEPEPEEPVRFYWVDEHGVEHDVSEEELHEFEIADEEDDR